MHSHVIQLSSTPLNREDFMTETGLYDELSKIGADYVEDYDDRSDMQEAIDSSLKSFLPGVFDYDPEKRTLTRRAAPDFSAIEAWWENIQKQVAELSAENAVRDCRLLRFHIETAIRDFGDMDERFCINGSIKHPTDAIEELLNSDQSVWYVGGAVSYHY